MPVICMLFFVLLFRVMDTMFLLKARKYQMLIGLTFLPKVFRYSFVGRFISVFMCYLVAVRFLFLSFSFLFIRYYSSMKFKLLGGFQRKSCHDNKIFITSSLTIMIRFFLLLSWVSAVQLEFFSLTIYRNIWISLLF